ncbi:hypothetical protein GCM10020219_010850 [Nonomuraea dietziae]
MPVEEDHFIGAQRFTGGGCERDPGHPRLLHPRCPGRYPGTGGLKHRLTCQNLPRNSRPPTLRPAPPLCRQRRAARLRPGCVEAPGPASEPGAPTVVSHCENKPEKWADLVVSSVALGAAVVLASRFGGVT